jgi:hypothetical protein
LQRTEENGAGKGFQMVVCWRDKGAEEARKIRLLEMNVDELDQSQTCQICQKLKVNNNKK